MLKNFNSVFELGKPSLLESDLEFVVNTVAPEFKDRKLRISVEDYEEREKMFYKSQFRKKGLNVK
jgi:hypothetical protein